MQPVWQRDFASQSQELGRKTDPLGLSLNVCLQRIFCTPKCFGCPAKLYVDWNLGNFASPATNPKVKPQTFDSPQVWIYVNHGEHSDSRAQPVTFGLCIPGCCRWRRKFPSAPPHRWTRETVHWILPPPCHGAEETLIARRSLHGTPRLETRSACF